ncbi:MAG: DUF3830 family protein [Xanthomonadales bacterium]|nr:DUF3830 family protein [Xanthomonadales bacterium]
MRQICFKEKISGLSVRCELLQDLAPKSSEFLWKLASARSVFTAVHAIWTGPELSCPLPASVLPSELSAQLLPAENATSYPASGDVVMACVAAGSVKGLPPGNFFDLGVFYGEGGRLLMPFGWISANVCARVLEEDLDELKSCMKTIRKNGECRLEIAPIETGK